MLKIVQKFYAIPLVLTTLLLLTQSAIAAAPEGHLESLDSDLNMILLDRLDREGYLGPCRYGQDLSRSIAAYLWDNRQQLTNLDFPNARQVDVLVCLMSKKGYSRIDKYASEIKDWCSQRIKDF